MKVFSIIILTASYSIAFPNAASAQKFNYTWGLTYGQRTFEEFPQADKLNAISVLWIQHPKPGVNDKLSGFVSRFEGAYHWQDDVSGLLGNLLFGYETGKHEKWSLFLGVGGGSNSLNVALDDANDIKGSSWFYSIGGDFMIAISDRSSIFVGFTQDFQNKPTYTVNRESLNVDISGTRFLVGVTFKTSNSR